MFDDLFDFSGNWADAMLERMQAPGARERMQKAFDATPEELGRAALEAAQQPEEFRYAAKHYETRVCRGCCYGSHCLGADPDCVCCKK
jgi:hypothetical protein